MATKITRKDIVTESTTSNALGIFEIVAFEKPAKFKSNTKQIVTFLNSQGVERKAELSAGCGYEADMIIQPGTPVEGLKVAAYRCDESFLMGGILTHRTVRFVLQRRHDTSDCVMSADDL